MADDFALLFSYEDDLKQIRREFDLRRHDNALAILRKYEPLFADDVDYLYWNARILQNRGNFIAAEPIWARLLQHDPNHGEATGLWAACLANVGRREEALAMIERARQRDPDSNPILHDYLLLLLAERGIQAAIAALDSEHRRRSVPRRLEVAIEKLREKAMSLHDIDDVRAHDPDNLLGLDQPAVAGGYSLRSIYEAFEPVGCNCEFGFIQRKHGAEPLALFRWTSIDAEQLIALLACDMEGYDRPDIYSLRGDEREYLLHESAFGTLSHTGVNQRDIAAEELLARLTRRQAFLKRKFLDDAAAARKIFLYKADAPLSDAEMGAIEAQFHRLGVRFCLFVMPTPDKKLAGTAHMTSDRRAVGYLSAVMPHLMFDEWNRIVVAVYDLFLRGHDHVDDRS